MCVYLKGKHGTLDMAGLKSSGLPSKRIERITRDVEHRRFMYRMYFTKIKQSDMIRCERVNGNAHQSSTGIQPGEVTTLPVHFDNHRVAIENEMEENTRISWDDTADVCYDGNIASISRLALYNSGTSLSSHTVQMTRGSIYQQSNSNNIAVRGGRPLASILVIGMTFGTAAFAAVRSKLKAVRECTSCQGYGVQRCKLCSGKGTIDWEGKMAHREPCPMCLGRRLIKCTVCGGGILFSRSLFIHKANKGEDALMETLQTLTTPSMRLFGSKTSDIQQEARLAESDEYSKEILSD